MKKITIYSDGACRGNPGPGGWGVLMEGEDFELELHGGERSTTNNRMELTAAIEALKALPQRTQIAFYTDSQYVRQGITSWIKNWKARGWRTADRKPVKNRELWEMLDQQVQLHEIEWHWVRGHTGHDGNERADQLANLGIDETMA